MKKPTSKYMYCKKTGDIEVHYYNEKKDVWFCGCGYPIININKENKN